MPLAFPVEPMKAALGTLPVDDEQWAYEIKWDGYRTLAFLDDGAIKLQSSHLLDVTAKYPELAELHEGVHAKSAILDGELVVLDDEGRPRFELIQVHKRQAVFVVFDVLQIDGHDTVALTYEDRRRLLDQLVEQGDNWMISANQIGDGAALLDATFEQELEGVMAKRLGSLYVPGKRSPNWRKVKNRRKVELHIGGFTRGDGNRTGTFGSLLVGRYEGDMLRFAGGVGTGFNQRRLETMTKRMKQLATTECPFDPVPPTSYRKGATWIRPELRALVEITEFTNDGFVRQASFVELVGE